MLVPASSCLRHQRSCFCASQSSLKNCHVIESLPGMRSSAFVQVRPCSSDVTPPSPPRHTMMWLFVSKAAAGGIKNTENNQSIPYPAKYKPNQTDTINHGLFQRCRHRQQRRIPIDWINCSLFRTVESKATRSLDHRR